MKNKVEWKLIEDFPNYEVSNTGLVRNIKREKILSQQTLEPNYMRTYQIVSLWKDNKNKKKKVHKLVWETFNECECKQTINHIDENKRNNNLNNLECISDQDNKLKSKTKSNRNIYKLSNETKRDIMIDVKDNGLTTWGIMKKYGLPTNYIHMVIKRGSWDKYYEQPKV